jgi:hypothetical protein
MKRKPDLRELKAQIQLAAEELATSTAPASDREQAIKCAKWIVDVLLDPLADQQRIREQLTEIVN